MGRRSFPSAICHLDCNSFFASVEMAYNPSLIDKPVMVGGIGGGCIITANYIARGFGIYTGMSYFEAKRICPNGVFIQGDFRKYSIYNERVYEIIKSFTPMVEEASIDEFYFDLTGMRTVYHKGYPEICYDLKEQIKKHLGITVSIGVSINKTWAKVGSNYKKPDAITVISGKDLEEFQQKFPLKNVKGIGNNTFALLTKFGLDTMQKFITTPENIIQKLLGKTGVELQKELKGEKIKNINPIPSLPKSLARTRSFSTTNNPEYIYSQLVHNLTVALWELRRKHLKAGKITAMLRTKNYKVDTFEMRMPDYTNQDHLVLKELKPAFQKLWKKDTIYRSSGIITLQLLPEQQHQPNLFSDVIKDNHLENLFQRMDSMNHKYGQQSLSFASSARKPKDKYHLENLTTPYLGEAA